MNRVVILLILGAVSIRGLAQEIILEKPNYKRIEKNISQEDSDLFYPVLIERFLQADTTFSLTEKRHLYYGYSFQPGYSPYGHSDYSDSVNALLNQEELAEKDLSNLIRFGDSILHEQPFDLRVMNYQAYALERIGMTDALEKKSHKWAS